MKTIILGVVVSLLVLSGLALGQSLEAGKKTERASSMEEMMKGDRPKEHMGSMMRMMKMMDQCSAMMESAHMHDGGAKDSQKQ